MASWMAASRMRLFSDEQLVALSKVWVSSNVMLLFCPRLTLPGPVPVPWLATINWLLVGARSAQMGPTAWVSVMVPLPGAGATAGGTVTVRFSNSTGLPLVPDNDPNANPRGMAVRFNLAEHSHTDIVSHSTDGFPARTGEEFLEFLRALASTDLSKPSDPANPSPLEKFLGAHPADRNVLTRAGPSQRG